MVVFERGQQLSNNDLVMFVYDRDTNQLVDPFSITYAIFDRTSSSPVPLHRGSYHRRDRKKEREFDAYNLPGAGGQDSYNPFQNSINQDHDSKTIPDKIVPPFQMDPDCVFENHRRDHHDHDHHNHEYVDPAYRNGDPYWDRHHPKINPQNSTLLPPVENFREPHFECEPQLVGNNMAQVPTRTSVGFYWANIRLDDQDNLGEYEIVWEVKLTTTSATDVTRQRFSVVNKKRHLEVLSNTGGVAYYPGQILGPKELFIQISNERGNPADPFQITYAIYDKTTGMEILMGSPANMPVKLHLGKFYANYVIPDRANVGDWVIRWSFVLNQNDTSRSVVQEFAVVQTDTVVSSAFHEDERTLIRSVRFLLRDNNPDRNYRFVPPDDEKVIQHFTETFGFMWTDEEIYEYLILAIDAINYYPPIEAHTFATLPHMLRSLVTIKAASYALTAISINWIHDEFDYNIGGVSLAIEKSSKFQGMGDKLEQEYDTAIERYKDYGVKYVKGIQQPRFGIGVSSALGPFSGRGVQARRNFISSSRI